MSWISGWLRDEKKNTNYIIGADTEDIIEKTERYGGVIYVTFKPQTNINFLVNYLVYGVLIIRLEWANSSDILQLKVSKMTISTTENQIDIDYLKNVSSIRIAYNNGSSTFNMERSNTTWNIENLQIVNTNNTSITPFSSIGDIPEITIQTANDRNNYNNAILTNFKNYNIEKCTTNLVIKGKLNSFYEEASTESILPQTYGKDTTQWILGYINDEVRTSTYDSNDNEIIISTENESLLDLRSYTNLNLSDEFWKNFYVHDVIYFEFLLIFFVFVDLSYV